MNIEALTTARDHLEAAYLALSNCSAAADDIFSDADIVSDEKTPTTDPREQLATELDAIYTAMIKFNEYIQGL